MAFFSLMQILFLVSLLIYAWWCLSHGENLVYNLQSFYASSCTIYQSNYLLAQINTELFFLLCRCLYCHLLLCLPLPSSYGLVEEKTLLILLYWKGYVELAISHPAGLFCVMYAFVYQITWINVHIAMLYNKCIKKTWRIFIRNMTLCCVLFYSYLLVHSAGCCPSAFQSKEETIAYVS